MCRLWSQALHLLLHLHSCFTCCSLSKKPNAWDKHDASCHLHWFACLLGINVPTLPVHFQLGWCYIWNDLMKLHFLTLLTTGNPQECSSCCLQTLISLTAMYETALVQGQPAPNAAEFNTYAFIMLLVGTRQKDALAAFFQVKYSYMFLCFQRSMCR